MAENDLRGTWKTRNGLIVWIGVRGISAQHGYRVYMGHDGDGRIYYWDMDGKSLESSFLDLMSKGVEYYGTMKF